MLQMYVTMLLISWAPVLYDMQRMQGTWRLTMNGNLKFSETYPKGMLVKIQQNKVISLERDAHSQDLFPEKDSHMLNHFGLYPLSKPKEVVIMWCEGIYEIEQDRIRFSIKYHGQGVEGEAARLWRPPVDFDVKDGKKLWTFDRVKK